MEAIDQSDYELYQEARRYRNNIVHEPLKFFSTNITNDKQELLNQLMALYFKLDRWWINEIEIPISGENPQDSNQVFGSQALIMTLITDNLLNNTSYEELLKKLEEIKFMK